MVLTVSRDPLDTAVSTTTTTVFPAASVRVSTIEVEPVAATVCDTAAVADAVIAAQVGDAHRSKPATRTPRKTSSRQRGRTW